MTQLKSYGRYSLLILATVCVTYFVENFLRAAASALTPVLIDELGISYGAMGLVISAYFFVYGLMQLPAGILSDSLGAKRTIVIFTSLTITGVFLFWASYSLHLLFTAQILVGVGCSVFYINAVRIVSGWFPPNRGATAIGVLSAASGLGNFVSYMGFPLAVDALGTWRSLYLGMSLLLLASWAMNVLILRDTPSPQDRGSSRVGGSVVGSIVSVFRTMRIYPIIAGYVLAAFGWVFLSWMPQLLIDTRGFTYIQAGQIASAGTIAGIPGCVVVAAISDRLRRRKLPIVAFSAAYTLLLSAFFALPAGWGAVFFATLSFAISFCVSFWVLFFSMIPETLPAETAGIGLGLVNGLGTLGFSVIAPVYGGLVDATGGYGASNAMLIGGAVAMTLIFALLMKETYGGVWRP